MGIPRKRQFEGTQHGTSKGFQELSVPSNLETLKIEKDTNQHQLMSDDIKARVT